MKETAPKRTVSFRLDEQQYLQAREVAHWERTSVTKVIEEALAEFVRIGQKKHNGGKAFEVKEKE